jgi:hypothetical protein
MLCSVRDCILGGGVMTFRTFQGQAVHHDQGRLYPLLMVAGLSIFGVSTLLSVYLIAVPDTHGQCEGGEAGIFRPVSPSSEVAQ